MSNLKMSEGVHVADPVFDLKSLSEEAGRSYRVPGFTGFPKSQGGVALDLGLNVGAFPLSYATQFQQIVAVEASSRCIDIATANLASAGVENVRILHRALGAESGKNVELRRVYVGETYESKDFSTALVSNHDLDQTDYPGRFGEVEEVVQSIDWFDLVADIGAERIAFLKCDIEGSEFDLLAGADLSMVDCLVLELHYTFLGRDRSETLIGHLNRTHRLLGMRESRHVRRRTWPPPSILWLANRRMSTLRSSMLSLLSSILGR